MKDSDILDLYFARDERAIKETDKKYGRYCRTIAYNVFANDEDAEETVNDHFSKNISPSFRKFIRYRKDFS